MSDTTKQSETELDEYSIRQWFMRTELEQAEDTFRVVEGIIETRRHLTATPTRKARSDKGKPRNGQQTLEGAQ